MTRTDAALCRHVPPEQARALRRIIGAYTKVSSQHDLDGSSTTPLPSQSDGSTMIPSDFTVCDVSESGMATSSALFRTVLLFFAGARHVKIIDETPRVSTPLSVERAKVVERMLRTQFRGHVVSPTLGAAQ